MTQTQLKLLAVVLAFGTLCVSYGYFVEPHRLVVRNATVTVKGWNPALDGFTIVMLSDIHGGSNGVTFEKLREVVALVNEQNADLVVVLGDYVAKSGSDTSSNQQALKMPMVDIADGLAGMNAKYGVMCVLGNHDGYYSDEVIAAELRRVGCQVLQNEVATISHAGQPLRILGLKDHLRLPQGWVQNSSLVKDLIQRSGTGDVVVLQHAPDTVMTLTGYLSVGPEFKLYLAGHTHGGQIWLPILGAPAIPSSYGQRYTRGHVNENGVDMYVTSGIGESLLPVRFLVPPEIVVLTVKSE